MPRKLAVFLGVLMMCSAAASDQRRTDLVLRYFAARGAKLATSFVCGMRDIFLHKNLSSRGIRTNHLEPANFDPNLVLGQLTSHYLKLGILLDMSCSGSEDVLRIAHRNDLFVQAKSSTAWLVFVESHVTREDMESAADSRQPAASDPVRYLMEPYSDTNNSDALIRINRRFNAKFVEEHEARRKSERRKRKANATAIDAILSLNLLPDNELLLAVPGDGSGDELYGLFAAFRITKESVMKFERKGTVQLDGRITLLPDDDKKSLEGALLRGVVPIYNLEKFTRLDDLSTRETDVWAKMSYGVVRVLQEDLRFRLIIRFYDDYGWLKNNSFTSLMGHLEKRKADLAASDILFRQERYPVVDYLDSPFRLQTGILFREPSLSSVANIFVLPFSPVVWISFAGLTALIAIALGCEALAGMRYDWHARRPDPSEIAFLVVAAVGQQGYYSPPISTTGRLIIFLLLFSCLALFTAFTAKIVALLQSSSSSISSLEDLTKSSFEVGIQAHFPLFDVELRESVPVHRTIGDFYKKKLSKRGNRVYFDPASGIEKIRRGLFAFEVDLTTAYKIIGQTYEEKEKCDLKVIGIFPQPHLGTVLQKNSPFREIFTRRLKRQAEVGLTARTWKRWIPQKPKCEAERISFVSVGLAELRSAIMIFAYGFVGSILILIAENLCWRTFSLVGAAKRERNSPRASRRLRAASLPPILEKAAKLSATIGAQFEI